MKNNKKIDFQYVHGDDCRCRDFWTEIFGNICNQSGSLCVVDYVGVQAGNKY